MAVQAIKYLYDYGPPVVVKPPGGAPLTLSPPAEVEAGTSGAPLVVSPPAVVQKPSGGADLSFGVRYLNGEVGTMSTPDTVDLTINGDTRWTAKVRDNSTESTTSRIIADRTSTAADAAWRIATYTSGYFLQGSVDGTLLGGSSVASRTEVGITPPGADRHVGARVVKNDTNALVSTNGTTWSVVGTTRVVPMNGFQRESASTVRIGTSWQGRIYWVQQEAINRARLVFPGVAGNHLSIPDLSSGTGDVEVVARVTWNGNAPNYDVYVANRLGNNIEFMLRKTSGSATFQLVWTDNTSSTVYQPMSGSVPTAVGQMVWLRARLVASTGAVSYDYAPDQPTEPTSWTSVAGGASIANTTRRAAATAVTMGWDNSTAGDVASSRGRTARVIVRSGIGGTTVLDVSENNAGVMATANTFLASTGQTVTVNQTTGNTIVQPQADSLVWRFDAEEAAALSARFVFPGVAGNYMSTPDAPALRVTGDIEIVTRIHPNTWRPAATLELIGKYATAGDQRAYRLVVNTTGTLGAFYSLDGVATLTLPSSAALPVDTGALWIKFTRVAATGVATMYTAPDQSSEPTTWTNAGQAQLAAGNLFAATAPVWIGQLNGAPAGSYAGRIMRSIIRSGIGGTTVLDVRESNATFGATSFVATTGQTVTVNQTAPNKIVQGGYTDPRGRAWAVTDPAAIVLE